MSPNLILILNACAYTFLSFSHYKKSHRLNIGVFITAWFALIAWIGVLYYNHELFGYFKPNAKITLFPFIYLFIAIYIFIFPILKFNSTQIQQFKLVSDKHLLIYIYVMLFVEVVSQISMAPIVIKVLSVGGSVAFREDSYDSVGGGIVITNFFLSKLSSINTAFLATNIIVSIYALIFSKLSKRIRIIFFCCSAILPAFTMTALGNRFYIMSVFVWIAFIVVFLSNFINYETRKKIIMYFTIISIPILISFVTISLGRFADLFEYQLYRYLGEPFVNYDTQFFYDLKENTWGRAYFTTFRKWLGYPIEFETLKEKWAFLDGITGVDTHVFYTFIGGFNIEFGFIVTLLIGLFVMKMYKRISKSVYTMTVPKLIALSYLGYICIQGTFLFPLQGGRNMELLGVIIAYFYFSKISIPRYQYKF